MTKHNKLARHHLSKYSFTWKSTRCNHVRPVYLIPPPVLAEVPFGIIVLIFGSIIFGSAGISKYHITMLDTTHHTCLWKSHSLYVDVNYL